MIEAPLAWSHKLGPGVKQVLEDHWVSEGRRGLAFLLQRAQHVAAVSLTNLLKDQATTTSGFRLRCHQTTGPGTTCCVLDANGSSNMDSDTLAVINLTQCTACALMGFETSQPSLPDRAERISRNYRFKLYERCMYRQTVTQQNVV